LQQSFGLIAWRQKIGKGLIKEPMRKKQDSLNNGDKDGDSGSQVSPGSNKTTPTT
jgi:hypothetical protein